jgi:hypothetical protein
MRQPSDGCRRGPRGAGGEGGAGGDEAGGEPGRRSVGAVWPRLRWCGGWPRDDRRSGRLRPRREKARRGRFVSTVLAIAWDEPASGCGRMPERNETAQRRFARAGFRRTMSRGRASWTATGPDRGVRSRSLSSSAYQVDKRCQIYLQSHHPYIPRTKYERGAFAAPATRFRRLRPGVRGPGTVHAHVAEHRAPGRRGRPGRRARMSARGKADKILRSRASGCVG